MSEHFHRTHPHLLAAAQRPPTVERQAGVLAVTFRRGEGCCEVDPVRECVAYYQEDGTLIYVEDAFDIAATRAGLGGA